MNRQIKKKALARQGVEAEHDRLELKSPAVRRRSPELKRDASKKILISLRIDRDVLEWLRERGRGYQTRINTVLRAFRDASI